MNRRLCGGLLLAGYAVPLAFLATYGDAMGRTMALYAGMIAGFALLCGLAVKARQFAVVMIGNGLSMLSSLLCSALIYGDEWGWYFKPFTPNRLIALLSAAAFAVQLGVVLRARRNA